MTTERRDFDIAVVGAGAVGLAAALALAREGFQTALIGHPETRSDGRTVALLDGSVRLLRALGVWEAIERDASPMAVMQIVDDTGSLFRLPPVSFAATEIGLDAFGWNIENGVLVSHLAVAAATHHSFASFPEEALGYRVSGSGALVDLEDGEPVRASLVVAADGRRSRLREAAGIRTRTWRYPQAALVALLGHERDHRDTSTEFHTRAGPFTLVPMAGRRSALVWYLRPDEAERHAALDDAALGDAIERQAHSMLGEMRIAGPRAVIPITGLTVDSYVAPRMALVGEAAHVFPSIGAQGLNLGFRDVAALRDAVVDARHDVGSDAALSPYQRGRDLDVRLRSTAVHGLNTSLLTSFLPVDFLRGAGLLALGSIGPLRRAVMREGVVPSMGTPRLMRGEPLPRSERERAPLS